MSARIRKVAVAAVSIAALGLSTFVALRIVGGTRCTIHGRVEAQMRMLGEKIRIYRCDTGHLPATLQALTEPTPLGPYANDYELRDGWGRLMHYEADARQQRFGLFSLGRDGLPGGDGADADIVFEGSQAPLSRAEWYRRGQPVESFDCRPYRSSAPESLALSHLKAARQRDGRSGDPGVPGDPGKSGEGGCARDKTPQKR
ncbi:type II secretion system protein GspG [Lysobacter enzymogenes]|uniref:type II secretion system protein GspG n=1 Tax=Lysobacter enzymogenes TaxID=69 RepID=UPI0019D205B5|nr:type II secretion system protein GspG [Lysobacter enzymogenes]